MGNRRQFLSGLGTLSVIVLAGCGSSAEGTPETDAAPENADTTPGSPTTQPATDTDASTDTRTSTPTPTERPVPTQQTAKIVASDGDSEDKFGWSVGVDDDGTTVVVGAYADEDPNGEFAGSGYLFERSGGSWSQRTKLIHDAADDNERAGRSVAVSGDGDTVLLGAPFDDNENGTSAGAAYAFARSDGDWTQQGKLIPESGDHGDGFGHSATLSGDGTIALVGAPNGINPDGAEAGVGYVFERSDDFWGQRTMLSAEDGEERDSFGQSVGLSGDGRTLLLGAPEDDNPNGNVAGAAYVFERSSGSWNQRTKLVVDEGNSNDRFGSTIAVSKSGDTAIVGSPFRQNENGDSTGSAYVFLRSDGGWNQQATLLASDREPGDTFGRSVAVSGDGTIGIVGEPYDGTPNGSTSGAAYVFSHSGGSWQQRTKLIATDGDVGDRFGRSVAVSSDGTGAIVGAERDEDSSGDEIGSAYIFE